MTAPVFNLHFLPAGFGVDDPAGERPGRSRDLPADPQEHHGERDKVHPSPSIRTAFEEPYTQQAFRVAGEPDMELQRERLQGAAAEPCEDGGVEVPEGPVGVAEDDVGEDWERSDVWLPGIVAEFIRELAGDSPVHGDGSDRKKNRDDLKRTEVFSDRCEGSIVGIAWKSIFDSNIDNAGQHADIDSVHVKRDSEPPFNYIPLYATQSTQDGEYEL